MFCHKVPFGRAIDKALCCCTSCGEKPTKCNQCVLAGPCRQSSAVLHYLFLSPPRPFLGTQSGYLDIHRAQDNARNSWKLEKRPTNTSDYTFLSCLLSFAPNMGGYSPRQCTVEKSWKMHLTWIFGNSARETTSVLQFYISFISTSFGTHMGGHSLDKTARKYTVESSKKCTQSGYLDQEDKQQLFFISSFLPLSLSLYLLLASHQDLFSEHYRQKKKEI